MLRRQAVVVVSLILIGLLCVNNVQAQSIKQWAIDATANSEFTSTRFSAAQMVGAPDTYPVSYTHLDVYKRQPTSCREPVPQTERTGYRQRGMRTLQLRRDVYSQLQTFSFNHPIGGAPLLACPSTPNAGSLGTHSFNPLSQQT